MSAPWGADALEGEVVLDLSSGIAGAFCASILAGAGACVVAVEDPAGAPLRRRAAHPDLAGRPADAPLHRFLREGTRSVVVDAAAKTGLAGLWPLVERADVILWSDGSAFAEHPETAAHALAARNPAAVVCSITPFGLDGPWAGRPATDLTLQAWGGGMAYRGEPDTEPLRVGGDIVAWASGTYAALAVLTALARARDTGTGDLLDLSMLECVALSCATTYPVTCRTIVGKPLLPDRVTTIPGIHPCRDGWVGFMVLTGQQWLDFCLLIGQPGWLDDESLLLLDNRLARREEIVGAIEAFTTGQTVAEVLAFAAELRVPAAPIGNGRTTPGFEQLAAEHFYGRSPDGDYLRPVRNYRLHPASGVPRPAPAPPIGADGGRPLPGRARPPAPATVGPLPLSGLRVTDLTAFWAGPTATRHLALLGADVVKVESPHRPDGFRYHAIRPLDEDGWWEWAPLWQGCNVGKRGLGLDLSVPEGREVLLRLVRESDVLIENFTPRVLDAWGLGGERLLEENPRLVVVRMPAFGLGGPWRDRSGYAQTMEQISGLAWLTGHPDGPPLVPNGHGDPLGGNFAAIATLVALEQRRRTGRGTVVESPLVLGALNLAAEQVLEFSAHGVLLERTGNRSYPATQGAYACADPGDRWVALSVPDAATWDALAGALGHPAWLADLGPFHPLDTAEHDRFDREIGSWCGSRTGDEIVETLWPAGVPVAKVVRPSEQDGLEQLRSRGLFEEVRHPVTGLNLQASVPARSATFPGPWVRRPAPLLGQHNTEILGALGYDAAAIAGLEERGVVGNRVRGGSG